MSRFLRAEVSGEGERVYVHKGAAHYQVEIAGPGRYVNSWNYTVLEGPDHGRMGTGSVFYRPLQSKSAAAKLDREISLYLDNGKTKPPSDSRLVVLDAEGLSIGTPKQYQLDEYMKRGSVDGDKDASIGIRYTDTHENDLAISLSPAELRAITRKASK